MPQVGSHTYPPYTCCRQRGDSAAHVSTRSRIWLAEGYSTQDCSSTSVNGDRELLFHVARRVCLESNLHTEGWAVWGRKGGREGGRKEGRKNGREGDYEIAKRKAFPSRSGSGPSGQRPLQGREGGKGAEEGNGNGGLKAKWDPISASNLHFNEFLPGRRQADRWYRLLACTDNSQGRDGVISCNLDYFPT